MNSESAQTGRDFWIWWVLACTLAFVIALIGAVGEGIMGRAAGGALFGASLGTAQWLVLRTRVSMAVWWLLASIAGGTVGFIVNPIQTVGMLPDLALREPVAVNAITAAIGAAQWLVLRRQVSRAGWWVLASIVGGAVTFLWLNFWLGTIFVLVSGIGYGAITGAVLVWLLRQPESVERLPKDAA